MGESVNLSWPFHARMLVEGIWNLVGENYHTDLQLIVDKNELDSDKISEELPSFNVHRLILAVFCPNTLRNYQSNKFYFQDLGTEIDQDTLNSLVELIYRGQVNIEERRLDKVKVGAEILGLNTIVDLVDNYFARKTLKEKKDKLENDIKTNRGARKRKNLSSKVFEQENKSYNSALNEMNLPEKSQDKVSNCRDLEDSKLCLLKLKDEVEENSESLDFEREKNCFGIESDSLEYVSKIRNKVNEGERCDMWRRTSSSEHLGRLRPRNFGISKWKKMRVEKVNSEISTAFDSTRNQYVCKFCDKGFSTKDRHARHVRCHENPDNLQKCIYCDYKTVEKYVLVQHLASKHHVDRDGNPLKRDIKCSDCNFTCVSNFQLKNHMLQKHSSKQFKCEECGHLFRKKALRERHILAKHRNERPYMCETCGHRAKTLNAFKSHLELHSGKKFVCEICGLALTLSCSLKRHMKLHQSNERPFSCHLCSFATRKRYNLRVHLRNVHKLEMDSTGNVKGKHDLIVSTNLVTQSAVMMLPEENPQNLDSVICIPELETIHRMF